MLRLVSSLSRVRQGVCNIKQLQKVQQCLLGAKADPTEELATAVEAEAEGEEQATTDKGQGKKGSFNKNEDGQQQQSHERRPRRNDRRDSSSQQTSNYQQRVLRTSQEQGEEYEPVSFGVNKAEATEYFNNQLKNLNTHMPLDVFSCLNLSEQQEKAMKYLLQDDEQRNIRGKLASQLKKYAENGFSEDILNSVEQTLQTAFFKDQSYFISERDFKTLIFTKEFLRIIPLFYNKKFFQANQTFLTQFDVVQIFRKARSGSEYYPLLEYLRYHRNFLTRNASLQQKFTSADKEIVDQLIQDIKAENNTNINYLLTFFLANNLVKLNIANILEAGDICKHFNRVQFGSTDDKSKTEFSGRLHELLNLKVKLGLSSQLQHYLCDAFMSFETYEQGLTSIALHILILARLAENNNQLQDLFTQYSNTFGQHKFDYYLKENLPTVLQSLQNKNFYSNYNEALKIYKNPNNNSNNSNTNSNQSTHNNVRVEFNKITYFDKCFAQNNGVIFYNFDLTNQVEPVVYRYDSANILSTDKSSSLISGKVGQYQDAYIQNQKGMILENLLKESTFNADITADVKKKQTELEHLKASDYDQYVKQMTVFIHTALDESYPSEENSIQNYFRSRNIHTPLTFSSRSSYSTINKKSGLYNSANRFTFSTANKVEELEDDLVAQQNNTGASEQKEEKSAKAFSDFMAKVREIDREAEKSNPFVTKDDIKKMKELQKQEAVAHAKDPHATTNMTPEKLPTKPEVYTKPATVEFFNQFFGSISNLEEAILRIEKELYDGKTENYQAIVNGLAAMPANFVHDFPEGKYLLYKAFASPTLYKKENTFKNIISNVDLKDKRTVLSAKTLKLGELSRDYASYIEETVVGRALEAPAYKALIEVCNVHYKRKLLKRILAHIIIFRPKLDKSLIETIVNTCKENKLGVTLFEFTYLLANDGQSNLTQTQLIQLLTSLKQFEEVHEDIETLVRVYLGASLSRKYDNKIIDNYVNSLIRTKNITKLMSMLERLRDFFFTRKIAFNETLSAEQNNTISEKFKQEQRDIVQQIFRMFMEKLNQTNLNTYARPLFLELTNMKFTLNEYDYIQGFKSMHDQPEDIAGLYDQLVESKVEFGIELIKCLLEIFRKHPKQLGPLSIRVLQEQIYSDKISIDIAEVNEFASLFLKNEKPEEFSDMLKFLLKSPHKVNDFTKLTAFKIVTNVSEEILKSFMKGQIEILFSQQKQEQIRQQLLQDRHKKRQDFKRQSETVAVVPTNSSEGSSKSSKQKNQQSQVQAETVENQAVSVKQSQKGKKAGKDQQSTETVAASSKESAQASSSQPQTVSVETEASSSAKGSKNSNKKAADATGGKSAAQEQPVAQPVVLVKKTVKLQNGKEVEFEEPSNSQSQEAELEEFLLGKLKNTKIVDKEGKRKVLRKQGVSKFKNIETYIKETHREREVPAK